MFEHPIFWLSLFGIGAVLVLSEGKREHVLAWALTLVSAGLLHFLAAVPVWALSGLALTGVFVALSAARGWNHWIVFTPVLGLWVAGKIGGAVPAGGLGWIIFTGFSFALVKIWTLLKDAPSGYAREINPSTVLAYLFVSPTFIAGPMHYFREFQEALRRPRWPDGAGWVEVGLRVVIGALKVSVLAPLLRPASLTALVDAQTVTGGQLAAASMVYYLVIYFDFSGYSDLAIAAARAMGLAAPENFNRPFLAVNIRDFWQRWHVTFSRVLTGYIFVPVSRALTTRAGLSRTPVMVIGYIVTFLICGFWHGSTLNFLIWGFYHAVGLILLDLYRSRMLKRRVRGYGPARAGWTRVPGRAAAIAATFVFVSLGWIPFVLPLETLRRFALHLTGL